MNTFRKAYLVVPAVLILMLLCGASHAAEGQFRSPKLRTMAERLEAGYGIDCNHGGMYEIHGIPVLVSKNRYKEISHIGFSLFSDGVMEQSPSPVYRFVERYLLELVLLKDNAAIRTGMKEDKVTLRFGEKEVADIYGGLLRSLPLIRNNLSLTVTTDNSYYAVSWFKDGKSVFCMRFPLQYELLWGINKKDLEMLFYPDFMHYVSLGTRPLEQQEDMTGLEKANGNCYVWTGDWYGIEAMNSNRYYKKNAAGGYEPLCSSSRPDESACNLFTLQAPAAMQATVTQRMYGRKKQTFTVGLQQLLDFCRAEGCKVFAAIEKRSHNRVEGSATLLNQALGYIHVISFSMDSRMLEHPADYEMKLEIYAYVPTHNIHTLFHDDKNKQTTNNQ